MYDSRYAELVRQSEATSNPPPDERWELTESASSNPPPATGLASLPVEVLLSEALGEPVETAEPAETAEPVDLVTPPDSPSAEPAETAEPSAEPAETAEPLYPVTPPESPSALTHSVFQVLWAYVDGDGEPGERLWLGHCRSCYRFCCGSGGMYCHSLQRHQWTRVYDERAYTREGDTTSQLITLVEEPAQPGQLYLRDPPDQYICHTCGPGTVYPLAKLEHHLNEFHSDWKSIELAGLRFTDDEVEVQPTPAWRRLIKDSSSQANQPGSSTDAAAEPAPAAEPVKVAYVPVNCGMHRPMELVVACSHGRHRSDGVMQDWAVAEPGAEPTLGTDSEFEESSGVSSLDSMAPDMEVD